MFFSMKYFPEIFVKRRKMKNFIAQNMNLLNNLSTKTNIIEEKVVNIDGVNINYAKTGTGEHAVLLLPGIVGTIWTDFKPQIENFNKEKFTIVAWDPPGYGKSRPPNRTFPKDYHQRDATWACNLMKTLGFNTFSLLGWSDGGITSLIFAATYPDNVQKMAVIAPPSYMTANEMEFMEYVTNIDAWSDSMREPLMAIYEEKYFADMLADWLERRRFIYTNNNGDLCKSYLPMIKCPTLITYGEKDVIVAREHPDYLHANIKNSKLKTFKDGAHNLHLRYPVEFNALVQNFLLGKEDCKL